jgi:hypothetical protein
LRSRRLMFRVLDWDHHAQAPLQRSYCSPWEFIGFTTLFGGATTPPKLFYTYSELT